MKLRRSAVERTRVAELGEDLLLQRLSRFLPVSKRVFAGSGDDVAVVGGPSPGNLLVLKTDCVVEGIHFDSSAAPEAVGWKAMMRPLSDFAAASALPEFAMVTLITRAKTELSWVTGLYRGLSRAARRFRVSVVGGETSATSGPSAISVSIVGQVEKNRWVSRRGGKSGDHLFVTGRLGNTIRGKHLRFVPRIEESRWLTAEFRVHAMMDLSDGLGVDLPRLAQANRLGFEVQLESLPRNSGATIEQAVSGGEDYELLFAVSPRDCLRLQQAWAKKFPNIRLTRVGSLVRRSATSQMNLKSGYVHFR